MANVFDVAAYILSKTGEITTMKLQKLVYYAQAWSLVWDEEPLFPEKIEAWCNGPVVRDLYNYHKGFFKIASVGNRGKIENLSKDNIDTINAVLEHYQEFTSQQLSDLTHQEKPWKETREGLTDDVLTDREITHASMAEYYSSL